MSVYPLISRFSQINICRHLSTAYQQVENIDVRELETPPKTLPSEVTYLLHILKSSMGHHQFNRNFSHKHYVVIYLSLLVICCQNKSRKSQIQKQRDQERMARYIECTSVCSLFLYHSVDNQELRSMIPRQILELEPKLRSCRRK